MRDMSFIIKYIPSGMYICSHNLMVFEKVFARRFSSEKQAKAYIRSGHWESSKYAVCKLTDNETAEIEHNIRLLTEQCSDF